MCVCPTNDFVPDIELIGNPERNFVNRASASGVWDKYLSQNFQLLFNFREFCPNGFDFVDFHHRIHRAIHGQA